MAKYKGTGLMYLKKIIRAYNLEARLLAQLNPEETKIYKTLMPITWVPVEIAASFWEKTAALVYPDDPESLIKLGVEQAKDQLTGIYRILLRVITVPFLAEQTARLWSTFYDEGIGAAELDRQQKAAVVLARNFPSLPKAFRAANAGFIQGAVELTHAKNVKVKLDESDPSVWKWRVTWE